MGRYSPDAIKNMDVNRTDKAVSLIKSQGGKVHSIYALLGGYDLALIVELANVEIAMKVSLGLSLLTGISFSSFPAVSVDDFDKIMGEKKRSE
jgi:uncharacterized protein with GYD domain